MAMDQNSCTPVNIEVAGKLMFIPQFLVWLVLPHPDGGIAYSTNKNEQPKGKEEGPCFRLPFGNQIWLAWKPPN